MKLIYISRRVPSSCRLVMSDVSHSLLIARLITQASPQHGRTQRSIHHASSFHVYTIFWSRYDHESHFNELSYIRFHKTAITDFNYAVTNFPVLIGVVD